MNILISGLSGFIGKNLYQYINQYHSTSKVFGLSRDPAKLASVFEGDKIHCFKTVNKAILEKYEIDTVVHLAGIAHDLSGNYTDEDYYRVNFGLTKELYDAYLDSQCTKKFVYVSSVKALADKVDHILTEENTPGPRTPYGLSKLKAENYIQQHTHKDKQSYILRPAMVYGNGNKGNLNLLYKVINMGLPYPLGAFDNERSFLSVKNLCFIIAKIVYKNITPGDYNCSDDQDLSTVQLVQLIAGALNKKAHILKLNKGFMYSSARLGSFLKLPFNTAVLNKLTENYRVSSDKLLSALGLEGLPYHIKQEISNTIKSFEGE